MGYTTQTMIFTTRHASD